MLRAYKYRIYPTKVQVEQINKNLGCVRLIYNLALETKIWAYRGFGVSLSAYDLQKQMVEMKADYEWMREVDSQSLNQAILNMDKAFKGLFRGVGGFPKFKKRSKRQSFQAPCNKREIDFERGFLTIPKLENIPINITRTFKGEIKTVTISKTPTDKYFASILVDNHEAFPEKKEVKNSVGIDVGIKTWATLSDGTSIENPKYLRKNLERLAILQYRVSRKKKGGKNKRKAVNRVAVLHEKIANSRKDFAHKASNLITKDYDTICMEDLYLKGMTRRAKPKKDEEGNYVKNGAAAKSGLNKSLLDAGFGLMRQFIEYKSEWRGNNFIEVDRFFASSKTCNKCGHVHKNITLKDREWDCENCGEKIERDPNAASNIHDEGLRIFFNEKTRSGTPEEPVERRTKVRAKKQEYKKSASVGLISI